MHAGLKIRSKRNAADIAGDVVCKKMGIPRNRLTGIERGYVVATVDEIARINKALDELIAAKASIQSHANKVGWPTAIGAGI